MCIDVHTNMYVDMHFAISWTMDRRCIIRCSMRLHTTTHGCTRLHKAAHSCMPVRSHRSMPLQNDSDFRCWSAVPSAHTALRYMGLLGDSGSNSTYSQQRLICISTYMPTGIGNSSNRQRAWAWRKTQPEPLLGPRADWRFKTQDSFMKLKAAW